MRINNKFLKNYYPIETDHRFQHECNFMDSDGMELLYYQVINDDISELLLHKCSSLLTHRPY